MTFCSLQTLLEYSESVLRDTALHNQSCCSWSCLSIGDGQINGSILVWIGQWPWRPEESPCNNGRRQPHIPTHNRLDNIYILWNQTIKTHIICHFFIFAGVWWKNDDLPSVSSASRWGASTVSAHHLLFWKLTRLFWVCGRYNWRQTRPLSQRGVNKSAPHFMTT